MKRMFFILLFLISLFNYASADGSILDETFQNLRKPSTRDFVLKKLLESSANKIIFEDDSEIVVLVKEGEEEYTIERYEFNENQVLYAVSLEKLDEFLSPDEFVDLMEDFITPPDPDGVFNIFESKLILYVGSEEAYVLVDLGNEDKVIMGIEYEESGRVRQYLINPFFIDKSCSDVLRYLKREAKKYLNGKKENEESEAR